MMSIHRAGLIKALSAGAFTVLLSASLTPTLAHAAEADSAYQLNLLYTNELFDNTRGGVQRGAEDTNNVDVGLEIDAGKAFGLTGGVLHLEGFYNSPSHFTENKIDGVEEVGMVDTSSDTLWRIYQVYYDQQLGKTDIRFGIYDLETEFAQTKPQLLFLSKNFTWNSALDLSGTMSQAVGTIGPGNFPYTPLAFRVKQTFNKDWSAQVVVANGASDDPEHSRRNAVIFKNKYGVTTIGEVDYQPTKYTKVMVGAWGMTALLPKYGPVLPGVPETLVRGDQGGYVGASTRLIKGEGRRGLDGFFNVGVSKAEVTSADRSFNGGFTYTGLFNARPADKIGLAVAINYAPHGYMQNLASTDGVRIYSHEDNFELTYRAHLLNDWVTLQPDVQYIVHPGYEHQNALVVGLHMELSDLVNF